MNLNYCVLGVLLASLIAHAMESESKLKSSQESKPKKTESKSSQIAVPKKTRAVPILTLINSFTQNITFNGQTKSLFELLSKPQNAFGKTPILEVDSLSKVQKLGSVRNPTNSEQIMKYLRNERGLYISNTHKDRVNENGKSILYGTIVVSSDMDNKTVNMNAQIVLGHIILENAKKNMQKSTTKKTIAKSKGKDEATIDLSVSGNVE